MLFWCWQKDTTTRQYRPYRVVLLFSNIKRWVFLRIRSDAFQSACDAASTKIRGWPPKTMPSSHLCVNCFRVSKIVLHGFCTDFARFQTVQMVQIVAKLDKGCRNCWVKNYVALIKNNDNSKLPETETNRRLALLISGPRVRVPGGAPQ